MNCVKALILMTTALAASLRLRAADLEPLLEAPRSASPAELGVGRLVPRLELKPISGPRFRLGRAKDAKATVVAFTSTTCPVTQRYGPTLAALEKEFSARGVQFVFVNPVESDTATSAKEMAARLGWKGPYVRDTGGRIAGALGARSTAEAYVLDAAGTVVYRGAVDDQYGIGYSKDAPARRHLASALEAVLAGTGPDVAATTAPGCTLDHGGPVTADAKPAYHSRISRILQQNCAECHRDGGVAPFSLASYQDVAGHAAMIGRQVGKGVMPPWFAAPIPGEPSPWLNDRSLPAADKADLLAWLAAGRPEGDPADAPLPRRYTTEWEIGVPDAVVTLPAPIPVKATGFMPYENVFVKPDLGGERWVQALEVRPSAREVVHHVLVFVVPPGESELDRRRRGDTAGGNYLAAYVPGNNRLTYPDGFAKHIPAGSTLHFQLHYTPNGTATRDQTSLGLVFARTPPRHEVRVAAISAKFEIPPGAANHEVKGRIPVPLDARLMSFMPHMHVRGKAYRYELELPDGKARTLLDVPRYDFNWQLLYRLNEYIDAPAGSVLRGTAHFDNSTNNPANPDPSKSVQWGEQTYDEMMLGYFEYYLPSVAPGTDSGLVLGRALRDGSALFNQLDRNRDGKITPEESPSPAQFRAADADHDGIVTRDELRDFLKKRKKK
jgi:mono/diheme cytochrome c family protein